jgi:hypothetical protein
VFFSSQYAERLKNPFSVYMKKRILLFASVVIASVAMAQQPSVGMRMGAASSGMRGDAANSLRDLLDFSNGAIKASNTTGFFAGVYTSIPVSDKISIEPAIYYAQKGYELRGELNMKGVEFLGVNAKAQLNSQYIDVPVVVKANLNGFQLFAGPQISYLTKADLKTTAGALGFNVLNSKVDATQQLNRWDAAITGGVGYQFGNGMNITAAYDHGLMKADANKNMESYNHSFKVGVGFTF